MFAREGKKPGSVTDRATAHDRETGHRVIKTRGHLANVLGRGKFLRLLGAAALGSGTISLLGTSACTVRSSNAEPTSAADLGITPDNSGSVNRLLLVRKLSHSSDKVIFPRGDYRIDNSGNDVVIRNFSGEFAMEAGARFVFENNEHRGLVFQGGAGASFRGVRSTFERLPTSRPGSEECWLFLDTSGTRMENTNVNGSAGAGLLFLRCDSPRVFGANVRNTMADGVHFANCRNGRADSVNTYNTGDDGLAFVNYADGPANTGGYATNIYVERSHSRGIAVVGQSGVTVENFEVNETAAAGLYVAQENSYRTRVSSGVTIRNGRVRRAGRIDSDAVTRAGIAYENISEVKISNVSVSSPYGRGVTGVARSFERLRPNDSEVSESAGTVKLQNIKVYDAGDNGFNLQGGTLYLYNLLAARVGRTAFFVSDANLVEYGKLVARDLSVRADDHPSRGFSFERNAKIRGSELWVMDHKAKPSYSVVNASGKQSGSLGTVFDRTRRRELRVENHSGLRFSKRG